MSATSYQLVLIIQTFQNEQAARSMREFANSIRIAGKKWALD